MDPIHALAHCRVARAKRLVLLPFPKCGLKYLCFSTHSDRTAALHRISLAAESTVCTPLQCVRAGAASVWELAPPQQQQPSVARNYKKTNERQMRSTPKQNRTVRPLHMTMNDQKSKKNIFEG